jgi:hypothetical protein
LYSNSTTWPGKSESLDEKGKERGRNVHFSTHFQRPISNEANSRLFFTGLLRNIGLCVRPRAFSVRIPYEVALGNCRLGSELYPPPFEVIITGTQVTSLVTQHGAGPLPRCADIGDYLLYPYDASAHCNTTPDAIDEEANGVSASPSRSDRGMDMDNAGASCTDFCQWLLLLTNGAGTGLLATSRVASSAMAATAEIVGPNARRRTGILHQREESRRLRLSLIDVGGRSTSQSVNGHNEEQPRNKSTEHC